MKSVAPLMFRSTSFVFLGGGLSPRGSLKRNISREHPDRLPTMRLATTSYRVSYEGWQVKRRLPCRDPGRLKVAGEQGEPHASSSRPCLARFSANQKRQTERPRVPDRIIKVIRAAGNGLLYRCRHPSLRNRAGGAIMFG